MRLLSQTIKEVIQSPSPPQGEKGDKRKVCQHVEADHKHEFGAWF